MLFFLASSVLMNASLETVAGGTEMTRSVQMVVRFEVAGCLLIHSEALHSNGSL